MEKRNFPPPPLNIAQTKSYCCNVAERYHFFLNAQFFGALLSTFSRQWTASALDIDIAEPNIIHASVDVPCLIINDPFFFVALSAFVVVFFLRDTRGTKDSFVSLRAD